eukprot:TRINITY_DN10075_c0_g1_i1.p1 TRINITY_DN10075_c0_g1~~TRINITY_DN10075_c0_g1_i1.p1  ORF type:complete len:825 (-),score=109.10 TRINITY_DN10075_c0_g1_i1:52-2274(-)
MDHTPARSVDESVALPPPVKKRKLAPAESSSLPPPSDADPSSPSYTMEYGCYCSSLEPPLGADSSLIMISTVAVDPNDAPSLSAPTLGDTIPSLQVCGRVPQLAAGSVTPDDAAWRALKRNDVRCDACGLFFHVACLRTATVASAPLPGDNGYSFQCRRCVAASPAAPAPTTASEDVSGVKGPDASVASQVAVLDHLQLADRPWMESLRVVFFNLRIAHPTRTYFHIKDEIVPFIEKYWDLLCIARPKASTWPNTITSTMSINHSFFRNGNSVMGGSGWWGCIPTDSPLISRLSAMRSTIAAGSSPRVIGSHLERNHVVLSADALAKKMKKAAQRQAHDSYSAPLGSPAVVAPVVAPPAPAAKQQEPSQPTPPKPPTKRTKLSGAAPLVLEAPKLGEGQLLAHPPILNSPSTYLPSVDRTTVVMVKDNSADQIFIDKSGLLIRNGKGYCMSRASFPAVEGAWYFEATVSVADPRDWSHLMDKTNREWPKPPHWRLGWSAVKSDVQTPPGADSFSYGWRDLDGSVFHEGKSKPYSAPYGPGDVIGFLIDLPHRPPKSDEPVQLNHSGRIIFFKNGAPQGVAFEGLVGCRPEDSKEGFTGYYPSVSAYYNGCINLNFGPDFKHPPTPGPEVPDYQPCCLLPAAFNAYRELHLKPPADPKVEVKAELDAGVVEQKPPTNMMVDAQATSSHSLETLPAITTPASTAAVVQLTLEKPVSVEPTTSAVTETKPAPDEMEGVVLLSS